MCAVCVELQADALGIKMIWPDACCARMLAEAKWPRECSNTLLLTSHAGCKSRCDTDRIWVTHDFLGSMRVCKHPVGAYGVYGLACTKKQHSSGEHASNLLQRPTLRARHERSRASQHDAAGVQCVFNLYRRCAQACPICSRSVSEVCSNRNELEK
jgi:hypothetical protein